MRRQTFVALVLAVAAFIVLGAGGVVFVDSVAGQYQDHDARTTFEILGGLVAGATAFWFAYAVYLWRTDS